MITELIKKANQLMKMFPTFRYGQALFGVLEDMDKEMADEIRGTGLDPFYDDKNVPAFLGYVCNTWEQKQFEGKQ